MESLKMVLSRRVVFAFCSESTVPCRQESTYSSIPPLQEWHWEEIEGLNLNERSGKVPQLFSSDIFIFLYLLF